MKTARFLHLFDAAPEKYIPQFVATAPAASSMANAFFQRSKRMVMRVPHYKSGEELAAEVARAKK